MKTYGLVAEFSSPESLSRACMRMRDEGFSKWDAYTPFPIHGLEKAMGLKRSMVSFFVLAGGLTGAALGLTLQWWTSVVDYPLVISGKPLFSWPAFVPIMFECGVLGGALGAVFGFLGMSRLPRHHHPVFEAEGFERVTDDGFFISVEAADPSYDEERTGSLLNELGATRVQTVAEAAGA